MRSFYTIRTIINGEADDRRVESEYQNLAGRLFDSTVELFRRNDWEEATVQLINPDGEIECEMRISGSF